MWVRCITLTLILLSVERSLSQNSNFYYDGDEDEYYDAGEGDQEYSSEYYDYQYPDESQGQVTEYDDKEELGTEYEYESGIIETNSPTPTSNTNSDQKDVDSSLPHNEVKEEEDGRTDTDVINAKIILMNRC